MELRGRLDEFRGPDGVAHLRRRWNLHHHSDGYRQPRCDGDDEPRRHRHRPPYIASDNFERTVTSGWGSADIGGIWTAMFGSSSAASVDGSTGKIATSPENTRYMALRNVSVQDSESSVQFSLIAPPANGHSYVGISARQNATQKYDSSVWMRNDGSIWILAEQSGTLLTSKVLSGMTWTNGDVFNFKTRVTGSNPTTIEAKIWKEGSTEPTNWQLSTTDSTSGLQGEGYASLYLSRSGSATQPTTVSFDNFRLVDLTHPRRARGRHPKSPKQPLRSHRSRQIPTTWT